MRTPKVCYLGLVTSLAILITLFLPRWSIRASGVSIDVYPFYVKPRIVPPYDADWAVDRLLTLDGTLLIVGLLVVVSGVLVLVGSLKLPPLLIAPVVLNQAAVFIFYSTMRSAIGRLAHGYFSGTNLVPAGTWGFVWGTGLCVFAGLASPIPLILFYWKRQREKCE